LKTCILPSEATSLFFIFLIASLVSGALSWDAAAAQRGAGAPTRALRDLSLEELGDIEVTSVSKTAEPLSEAAAAIYVITHDDIMRSGASSLPEMLRLAPNLQVAQVSANVYAISARGFNDTTANKLLVLIDGRSVYTPLFSGVFWDMQAVLPEDIDRIEVISGPGATLWGPNAVNGVINVITRTSSDTAGLLVTVEPGDFEDAARLRYGGSLGNSVTWRGYGIGFRRDRTVSLNDVPRDDSWHNLQGGGRVDWSRGADALTVQGDINGGQIDQRVPADQQLAGRNLLGRWTRRSDQGSQLQVQAYYDFSRRLIPGGSGDRVSVYDLDIQHEFALGQHHRMVWGGGYRASRDAFINPPTGGYFSPTSRTLTVGSLFVQDTIALPDDVELTLGTKIEGNSYTGFNAMPSGRLSWRLSERQLLWAAVSRAVRTPARVDRDLYQTAGSIVVVGGGPTFTDEAVTASELGFRAEMPARMSVSVSSFYNGYRRLRTIELSPSGTVPAMLGGRSGFLPATFVNNMRGYTYGAELWGDYAVTNRWRLTAGYNVMRKRLSLAADSLDVGGIAAAGNDPTYQVSFRSALDLPANLQLDLRMRRVAALPSPAVPGYGEADLRVAWQVRKGVELSLAGVNLLHERHQEFGTAAEALRHVKASVRWAF
jgi:iron complex outermembrane receptor protein